MNLDNFFTQYLEEPAINIPQSWPAFCLQPQDNPTTNDKFYQHNWPFKITLSFSLLLMRKLTKQHSFCLHNFLAKPSLMSRSSFPALIKAFLLNTPNTRCCFFCCSTSMLSLNCFERGVMHSCTRQAGRELLLFKDVPWFHGCKSPTINHRSYNQT